ncbi:hypothetical protein ACRE_058310 [Hapsidospora chrysogenum ATCC 11550]|uniref:Uncharacterized protein n=1 Tax=Hapsidospora chrysogenum (strain ATCC 11550 / CBS 779.69 / DSM 880 / IAM 14645 / JCM 23072 / IMI 49137) TaxID=857340 RepID=A0A086T240_HAPC1|nr:hypothetical protein ACRE_058310 [Hapsidospora chrysogenum ATCC 11550]
MATRNTHRWDQKTHEDILLEIFVTLTIPPAELQKVVAGLHAKGYTFSENALRHPPFVIMVRGWDATSHEALLMCLIDEVKPNKALLTEVTKRMNDAGWSYSYDAINQHIQKLRKNRDTTAISNAAAGNSAAATGTPKKAAAPKKVAATPRKKATPKKSKAKVDASDVEDDEDFEKLVKKEQQLMEDSAGDEAQPAKRLKRETT